MLHTLKRGFALQLPCFVKGTADPYIRTGCLLGRRITSQLDNLVCDGYVCPPRMHASLGDMSICGRGMALHWFADNRWRLWWQHRVSRDRWGCRYTKL